MTAKHDAENAYKVYKYGAKKLIKKPYTDINPYTNIKPYTDVKLNIEKCKIHDTHTDHDRKR